MNTINRQYTRVLGDGIFDPHIRLLVDIIINRYLYIADNYMSHGKAGSHAALDR